MLAKKIKENYKSVKIKIIKNRTDPDKRDYFVSNRKIEKSWFQTQDWFGPRNKRINYFI